MTGYIKLYNVSLIKHVCRDRIRSYSHHMSTFTGSFYKKCFIPYSLFHSLPHFIFSHHNMHQLFTWQYEPHTHAYIHARDVRYLSTAAWRVLHPVSWEENWSCSAVFLPPGGAREPRVSRWACRTSGGGTRIYLAPQLMSGCRYFIVLPCVPSSGNASVCFSCRKADV